MLAFALAGGLTTALVIPSASFLGRAFVITSDRPASSSVLSEGGIEAVVSNPVILRAATSLIDAGFDVPAPDSVEKIGVALGLAGSRPTGSQARLAIDMARAIHVRSDEGSGNLRVEALSPDPKNATQIATAVALAFVAEQDEGASRARRQTETELAARLGRLKAEAASARRRLGELGGIEADPIQVQAAAAAQTAAAQARLDTIRIIVTTSSPPLSDRRDVPSGIETLQTTYLDLSRQLAKARETLGDRHTTIISLQDGVRRAAAGLTAEWKRLARIAEVELQAAHARESDLKKALNPADAKRREVILEARRRVQVADDNLVQAQSAARDGAVTGGGSRLSARPALSAIPVGYDLTTRASIACLVGVLAFACGKLGLYGFAASIRRRRVTSNLSDELDLNTADNRQQPSGRIQTPEKLWRPTAEPFRRLLPEDMTPAMLDLLRGADPMSAQFGGVPTIMVASLEADLDTTSAALAIGRAAVREERRVLIVEANRPETMLAVAAAMEGDPILVDFFGTLRVALPAEASTKLSVAPALDKDFASALARRDDTPFVEDLAAAFDLIVVDGGRADQCAAVGWGADAYLRVGRFASIREDERFLAIFEDPEAALLGLVVAATVIPRAGGTAQQVDRQDPARQTLGRRLHAPVQPASSGSALPPKRDVGRRSRTARG